MQNLLKLYLLFVLIIPSFLASAQNDDFQDTRKKTESFARLQPKELRVDVATFALGGISESVGSLPLEKVSYKTFSRDSMTFEGEGIKAKIKISPFDASKHKLTYDEKYLVKIDKRTYYGDYGKMPRTYISEVSLVVDNDTVLIPAAAYSDLFNLNLTYSNSGVNKTTNGIYKSKNGHRLYFYLFCKNNTGSYEVTWIIQDRKYVRRVLDYGFM